MDYVPVRVNTLRGDQKIEFDVFIRINEKMLLYLRRGDSFEGERLRRLKSKKLKKMFIDPKDEGAYRIYLQRNIEAAYDKSSDKDLSTRAEIVHGDQQAHAEQLFDNPEAESVYVSAKEGAGRYAQFLINESAAARAIFAAGEGDQSISHHGISVATLAVELARKTGIDDPKRLQLLSLGALIHDLGHQDAPYSLVQDPTTYSAEQRAAYRAHANSAERFQSLKHFDAMVTKIIAQHEECADGSGFPRGLAEKDLDTEVILVALANCVDRDVTFGKLSRPEAAKKLLLDKIGKYPLPLIKMVGEVFKGI